MANVRIGQILGIPILVNVSFAIPVVIATWILSTRVYPEVLDDGDLPMHLAMACVSVLVFFAALIVHELAHSVVARREGLPVRDITLFVLGGVARIAREPRRPVAEMVMAAAGPLTSLVIGVLFLLLWFALGAGTDTPLQIVVSWLAWMNAVVAVFNFVPIFPLDGGARPCVPPSGSLPATSCGPRASPPGRAGPSPGA